MYMEYMYGKNKCQYKGEAYPHGTELCVSEGCKVCDDGKFIEAEGDMPIGGVYIQPEKVERIRLISET